MHMYLKLDSIIVVYYVLSRTHIQGSHDFVAKMVFNIPL